MSELTRRAPAGPGGKPAPRFLFVYLALALAVLWMWQETFQRLAYQPIAYSSFKQALAAGEVKRAAVAEQHIEGELLRVKPEGGEETVLFRTSRVEDPKLTEELLAAEVEVVGVHPSFLSQLLWAWLLPLALIFGLWLFLSRRFAAAGAQALSFGKSRARLVADADTGVDFSDVEGCREAKAELVEVVDYLKSPERYRALGARIPKGVLLLGPPGTGKTLLARAVAGEAGVPFYSISGSDFVEMFVGVGAARVRDLFAQAKAQAPCIVFIDEIDAIGRQRGVQMGMVNDEREQTLNQLLVELDGFDANSGVIVLAATNRPEVLDRALLRPGRFDRQVLVDAPDRDGREAILRLHVANKPLARGVDLARVARATPGFSGADLANVANEAALMAARERSQEIAQHHLEEAVEKVVAGPERKSRRLTEADRRRVAFHEVGHALVAARSEGADPVHKISIVPRGRGALGYTMQLPDEDRFLLSSAALRSRIRTLLAGRAAEELVLGDVSTGAQDDLARATALARQMITVYGMGESAGLASCAQPANGAFVAAPGGFVRDCSEATAREIDLEVKALLEREYAEARRILAAERDALERIAGELLQHESLDAARFGELLRQPLAA
jgi:cell division protease FtsH